MKKTINTMLIGLGNIGYKYDLQSKNIQTHFKAINNNKNFNLKMVIDDDIKKINRFNDTFNVPAVSSLKKKYLSNIDLVILAVPTSQQFKIFKKIIEFGYKKNFLVEKPFVYDEKKLNKILKYKFQNIFINYYRNFDDTLIKYLQKLNNSQSKLIIDVFYSKGFFHNFSHYLNLFIKIFGNLKFFKVLEKKKIKSDFLIKGIIKFKNASLRFINIDSKKESYFIITKNKKKILSYYQDGFKINGRLKPNKDYMKNVYINIYKAINKKKCNFFDINAHINFVKNLKNYDEI